MKSHRRPRPAAPTARGAAPPATAGVSQKLALRGIAGGLGLSLARPLGDHLGLAVVELQAEPGAGRDRVRRDNQSVGTPDQNIAAREHVPNRLLVTLEAATKCMNALQLSIEETVHGVTQSLGQGRETLARLAELMPKNLRPHMGGERHEPVAFH